MNLHHLGAVIGANILGPEHKEQSQQYKEVDRKPFPIYAMLCPYRSVMPSQSRQLRAMLHLTPPLSPAQHQSAFGFLARGRVAAIEALQVREEGEDEREVEMVEQLPQDERLNKGGCCAQLIE